MKKPYQIILCQYLNPINDKHCEWERDGAIVLKKMSNDMTVITAKGHKNDILKLYGSKYSILMDYSHLIALPGFFDMHFHWVQDDVRLMPKRSLLQWLAQYTWPYEHKFRNKKFSQSRAKRFADELLSVGTLGGACYSSIHGHTVDHALKEFVGDYTVGNVLMTMNSPEYLTQTKANAISLVKAKAKKYKNKYALTPRFAPTTHPDVMKKTAKVAKANKCFIQSHLSETTEEVDYVLGMFKQMKGFEKIKTYSEIYHKCGLLSRRTIMGHGIYLKNSEWELLAKTKSAVAHCPTSNAPHNEKGLGSGLFDFKKADRKKVTWALGTDIGGGPFLSMFDVMRSFVHQNRRHKVTGATYTRAFYRATLKGAEIMNLHKKVGSLDKNKEANLIFIKAPKVNHFKNAEDVFTTLLDKKSISRPKLDKIVLRTIYRGKEVFVRE